MHFDETFQELIHADTVFWHSLKYQCIKINTLTLEWFKLIQFGFEAIEDEKHFILVCIV